MLGMFHCYPFNCTTSIISTGIHDTLPNHVVWIQAVLNLQTPDWGKPKIKPAAAVPVLSPSNTPRGLADTPRETQLLWKKILNFWDHWKGGRVKGMKAGPARETTQSRCSPSTELNTHLMSEWMNFHFHSCSLSLMTLPLSYCGSLITGLLLGILIHGAGAKEGNQNRETNSCEQQAAH